MTRYIISIFLISFLFTACSKNKPYKKISSKEFQGVNKDALLNAAKKVIKLSDTDFEIDSTRTSLIALNTIPVYKGFDLDISVNSIEMIVSEEDNATLAKVKFIHKKNVLEETEQVIGGDIHKLFWDRVNYILGRNDTWPSCMMYRLNFKFDGILCDFIHNDNNIPTKNDIIKEIDFSHNKPIYKKEMKIADIDLDILKKIELPTLKLKEKDTNQFDNNSSIDLNTSIELDPTILETNNEISFEQ